MAYNSQYRNLLLPLTPKARSCWPASGLRGGGQQIRVDLVDADSDRPEERQSRPSDDLICASFLGSGLAMCEVLPGVPMFTAVNFSTPGGNAIQARIGP